MKKSTRYTGKIVAQYITAPKNNTKIVFEIVLFNTFLFSKGMAEQTLFSPQYICFINNIVI